MGQIVAVTAGKGGVGKSTTASQVSISLAAAGKRTLIMELDFGLRCQDIMLGIRDKVHHDIGEYISGEIAIEDALIKVDYVNNLHLMCATKNPFLELNPEKIIRVCDEMRGRFDYIMLDTAGIGSAMFSVIKAADLILMISTPDPVCVRDASLLSDFLYIKGHGNQKLIINKVAKTFASDDAVADLDAVMDDVGIPLLGVVPEDEYIRICGAKGLPLPGTTAGKKAYNAIAGRVLGANVPLTLAY